MKPIRQVILSTVIAGLSLSLAQPPAAISQPQVKVSSKDHGKGKVKELTATAYLAVAPDKVWRTVTNYGSYSQIMPRVSTSKISSRKGNMAIATMKLELPFPFQGTWYTNRYTENKQAGTVSWRMINGSIKDTQGSWTIKAQGAGTLATYQVTTDLGSLLIPGWMIDMASKKTVPDIFAGVEKHAKTL